MISRLFLPCLLLLSVLGLSAQPAVPGLYGKIDAEKRYSPPSGAYKIPLPVLPELGGRVADGETSVRFSDDYSTDIIVSYVPLDGYGRWELATSPKREFLARYFMRVVLPELAAGTPDVSVEETGRFLAHVQEGALFTCLLIPGGSAFESKRVGATEPIVAKRGNLCFERNGLFFFVTIEAAERVIEGASYNKTPEQENEQLKQRLIELVSKMEFPPPVSAAPAGK